MRKVLKYSLQNFLTLTVIAALLTAGCTFEKKSGFNRSMQNLTAHYNILFDANELVRLKQVSYATAFVDNYNEVLNVYQDTIGQTGSPDKDLELAIVKGNTIINTKEQSHYQSDAYMLLGRANFYEGNYFNAAEYFNYVIRTYKNQPEVAQPAYVWKGRTLLYLNQLPEAKLALDTALLAVNPKRSSSYDAYSAKLQYDIDVQNYTEGEDMAKVAVQHAHGKIQELRWKFILAQLEEVNRHTADAYQNYSQIAKSNAAFEMAFNASLNRIRIADAQEGIKLSREDQLKALLKDPNNKEFKDQIYYQIAQLQLANKQVDKAIANYKLSVRYNLRNQNQRGLSYLRLAEIYFKNKANYLTSKKYYDSTLTALPVNYPGYRGIQKLSNNLQVLADRMQIITREDTLQALARMDETTRKAVIDKMVNDEILQQQSDAAAATSRANQNDDARDVNTNSGGGSTFYFYNANAVSQGYSIFKQVWGNRKLEDNWRRSMRDNSNITNNTSAANQGTDPDAPADGQLQNGKGSGAAINYRQGIVNNLPLTPALLAQSNLRVYNAYVDLANFYRDVLDDKPEAIATFELILKRFPADPNKPAIYYSLYRLYSETDTVKSDEYKNRILKEYPLTPFARVINDPDYIKKLGDKDAEFTAAYNRVFDLYAHKKFSAVVDSVPRLQKSNPNNRFSAQLAYLQALAAGHNEKAGPFKDSLEQIVKRFPDDRLVTPLAKQNLAYINANQAEVMARTIVLPDDNPGDLPFTLTHEYKETTEYRHAPRGGGEPEPKPAEKPAEKPATAVIAAVGRPVAVKTAQPDAKKTDTLAAKPVAQIDANDPDAASYNFTKSDSTNYFFAIDVSTGSTNLASSRFGIGQFDRANYAGKGIKHQLMAVGDDNQVIFVGRFFSLKDVKDYARAIVPLLSDIMKVPKDKYSFFIITQENLNKFADKKSLDSYIGYYHKNY